MASAVVVARRENELSKAQQLPLENELVDSPSLMAEGVCLAVNLIAPPPR